MSLPHALPVCSIAQLHAPATQVPRSLQSWLEEQVKLPRGKTSSDEGLSRVLALAPSDGEEQRMAASGQSTVLGRLALLTYPRSEGRCMVVRDGQSKAAVPACGGSAPEAQTLERRLWSANGRQGAPIGRAAQCPIERTTHQLQNDEYARSKSTIEAHSERVPQAPNVRWLTF
jgi:hypothetical protein